MLGEVEVAHEDGSAGCWESPFAEQHCPDAVFAYSLLRQSKLSLQEHNLLGKIVFKRNGGASVASALISESDEVEAAVDVLLR